MATIDLRYQELTARMIMRATGGAQVVFQRNTGVAPNVTTTTATVNALIRGYLPDSSEARREGYAAGDLGAITLGERSFLVMASALASAGFPLPLQKGDNLISVDTGEKLKITRVDPYKRAVAGAIEGFAVAS